MENEPTTTTSSTENEVPKRRKNIKGLMLAVLAAILVAAVAGYGVYAWQQTEVNKRTEENKQLSEKLETRDQEVQALKAKAKSDDVVQTAPSQEYTFRLQDVNEALDETCRLNAKTEADIKVVQPGSGVGGTLAPDSEMGRISPNKTWLYASGGCGSQALGIVLTRLADNSWVVFERGGFNLPACDQVHGSGVPKEVIGRCIDTYNNDKELPIRE